MGFPDDITIFLWLSRLRMLRTHRLFGHLLAESMMGSHINGILR